MTAWPASAASSVAYPGHPQNQKSIHSNSRGMTTMCSLCSCQSPLLNGCGWNSVARKVQSSMYRYLEPRVEGVIHKGRRERGACQQVQGRETRVTSRVNHRTTRARVVVGEPHFSNQSMPSLTRSNLSA